MPGAADGAGNHGEGIGGYEESHGEVGAETSVLHAYLDAQRALLRGGETAEMGYGVAQYVAEGVVAKHDGESEDEEQNAALDEGTVYRGHNAADNDGKAGYGEAGHEALHALEDVALAKPKVKKVTDDDGDDGDDENLAEHAHGVDLHLCTGEPQHKQWGEDGSKKCGDAGHADAVGHIAVAEKRHDVARNASRTTTYEHNADGEGHAVRGKRRYLAEEPGEGEGYEGHDGELGRGSDEDVAWSPCEELEVGGAQRETHGEHDDADDDSLRVAFDPGKKRGKEEGDNGSQDDDKARAVAEKLAERKEGFIHSVSWWIVLCCKSVGRGENAVCQRIRVTCKADSCAA